MLVLIVLDDCKLHRAQAIDRGAVRARGEDKQAAPLLIIKLFEDDFPEPDDCVGSGRESVPIPTRVLQLSKVQLLLAAQHLL